MIDRHGFRTPSGVVARRVAFFECDKLQLDALVVGAAIAGVRTEIADTPPTTTVLLYGKNVDPHILISSGLQQNSLVSQSIESGPAL
ncbi:MAG TPA: hypothetical protein PKD20_02205 [Candidatus Saccharibacteria bacterium]|jgi:hypothetical protein|nr:hypothetical protein [Candidatus Saccharibacteria bacterium]HMT55667.1 hypothetical protein [Candidatus Saccharibacteria bacterium]